MMSQHTSGLSQHTPSPYSRIGPCAKCGRVGERFIGGALVSVFDRNSTRTWRPAFIERDEPYHGPHHGHISDGARILWADRDVNETWHSAGGWQPGRDIGPVLNAHRALLARITGRAR